MKFVEFFNPYNFEHLKAFRHLRKTGAWPENFIPDYVEMNGYWLLDIQYEMANTLIDLAFNGKIIGMPGE